MERIGHDRASERDLFVLEAASAASVPENLALSSPRFVCLLAWDARPASVEEVATLAHRLLASGAVYICAWGPDCERVHDICDEVAVGPNPPAQVDRVVMTTSHAGESLAEAILFAVNSAWPDPHYEEGCSSTLAVAIGSQPWAAEIRDAFADTRAFVARQLRAP
jgi:hypothetical protein